MSTSQITVEDARKILAIIDAGLVASPKPIAGPIRLEQAVCYALGLLSDDDLQCVSGALRTLTNALIESSDRARAKGLRRLALAQLGTTAGGLDAREFSKRVTTLVITKYVPLALRAAASVQTDVMYEQMLFEAANKCEAEGTEASAREARKVANSVANAAATAANAAAYAAYAATNAAYAADAASATYAYAANNLIYVARAARAAAGGVAVIGSVTKDEVLADFAEDVVQILIEMGAPGCQWLVLTETPL
jgi:hypothetical protein